MTFALTSVDLRKIDNVYTGLILQELLQGFSGARARDRLVERFVALPMLMPERSDHLEADFEHASAHCALKLWRAESEV